jgi:hypothetical protein
MVVRIAGKPWGAVDHEGEVLDISAFGEVSYRLGFAVELMMRFTRDWEIPNVRAMAAGLSPAPNDARMRFAFPSGISSTVPGLLRNGTG